MQIAINDISLENGGNTMDTNTNPSSLAQQGAGAEIMPAQSVPTETAVQPAAVAQPAAAAEETTFCTVCGKQIKVNSKFCPYCGNSR